MSLTDQADVFRAILAASAQTAERANLWAVAGPHLLRINTDESPRAELIAVPGDLGPMRSVRAGGDGGLLLGCRSGVMLVNPESPNNARRYCDPGVISQLGFNSAVLRDGSIWAAHGEAGLVRWDAGDPEKPRQSVRPASGPIAGFAPRHLVLAGSNRLIFSSGPQLFVIGEDGSPAALGTAADADVIGIISRSGWIITAHDDGDVCCWSADDLKLHGRQHRAGCVAAAAALPWLGDARLLLATDEGPVVCVGMDDELITQYASAYRGMRMVAGAADRVAGVSADRQRLILWHAWDGRKPIADLYIYGQARHRVADIAFA
jgi:hypothetical protein